MNDIKLNENLDLVAESGDFVVRESTQQHQQLLLLLPKGAIKSVPQVGVGIRDYLKDDNIDGLLVEIRKQLNSDGCRVKKIAIENGLLRIAGEYGSNS